VVHAGYNEETQANQSGAIRVKAEMLNIQPIMTSPIECKTNQPFKKSVALSKASPSPLTLGTQPIDIRYNITFSIT